MWETALLSRRATGDCILSPLVTEILTGPEPVQLHTFPWIREAAFYKLRSAIKASSLSRSVTYRIELSLGPLVYPTCRKRWLLLSSVPCQLSRCLKRSLLSGTLVYLGSPLGSNEWTAMGVCTLYGQHQNCTSWSFLEICCFSFLNLDILDKGWDPSTLKTNWTSGSHLTLANNWLHCCVFTDAQAIANGLATWFPQWSSDLVPPMVATTITYPRLPSLGKITVGVSCLTDTQNINQCVLLKPQYRPHLTHFGIPDVVKGDHFTSKNIQCWALEQGVQWNFPHPCQSQATSLTELPYGILKQDKI